MNSSSISRDIKVKRKWFYLLTLVRPANVLTSATNVLSGIAIAGLVKTDSYLGLPDLDESFIVKIILLLISSCCLYAGGIVFNDVFDFALDKIERPERALPSGKVTVNEAMILGMLLFLTGVGSAFAVSGISGLLAYSIVLLTFLYNYKAKHYKIAGPFTMGLCRAFNLCLGMSIVIGSLTANYLYSLIPLFYIIGITLISHGEVKGGNKPSLWVALCLYQSLLFTVVYLNPSSFPIVLIWAFLILTPLVKAIGTSNAMDQRKAVKIGVLTIILMDGALAAGHAGLLYALFIIALLPVSMFLGKKFSIT